MCNKTTNPCGCHETPCQEQNCACDVFLTSDCTNNVKSVFECLGIETGLTLTETLTAIDIAICNKFATITNYFSLINVGGQAEVYKGVNNLGQKEFRTISDNGEQNPLITIIQNSNTIDIVAERTNLTAFINALIPDYNASNVGTGAEVYKNEVSNTFNFRTLKSSDSSVSITQGADDIDIKVSPSIAPVFIDAGVGISVTGTGTSSDHYVIECTLDGSETELVDGDTTSVSGNGTIATPYSVEVKNLQKIIDGDYTIQDSDFGYTIFIDHIAPTTITVPASGIRNNFICQFYQDGVDDVTFVGAGGVTINNPLGLKIKGQYYWVALEKKLTTNTYGLVGSTKA